MTDIAALLDGWRSNGDAVTAFNTAFQLIQREQAAGRVRLGRVEQGQDFDAQMARYDEPLKAAKQLVGETAVGRRSDGTPPLRGMSRGETLSLHDETAPRAPPAGSDCGQ